MSDLLARLPELTLCHLQLSLWALSLGVLISLPLGVLAHRQPVLKNLLLGFIGVTQTIPSLALLAFMVPAIAALGPLSEAMLGVKPSAIGLGPALVALTLYGLLPILQNTVAGLQGVDKAIVEAARGVGMTERQVLLQVELPLALPVIAAGVRTAAVWTVGTAVLATPVGAKSLGDYIFVGLQTRNQMSIAVGCIGSAVLAFSLDVLIRSVERASAPNQSSKRALPSMILLGALLAATFAPWTSKPPKTAIVRVGSKAFSEGYLFAEMIGLRCESVGISAEQVGSLGSAVIFEALRAGEIDAYLDFSGTILANVMKEPVPKDGPKAVFPRVEQWLKRTHGIRVAARLGYENRYAFGVRRSDAERLGLKTLSDLARFGTNMEAVASYEFFDRPEWASVQTIYELRFAHRRTMEQSLAYEAIQNNEVDVVVAYSTDARVRTYDLVLLEDDRGAIPPYEAMILVGPEFFARSPRAMRALSGLSDRFSEASVQALNAAMDGTGTSPRTVAEHALEQLGLR